MDTLAAEAEMKSLTLQSPPCSASAVISKIYKTYNDDPENFIHHNKFENLPTSLLNYRTGIDIKLNEPYIEAEVRLDSLDTGSEPNDNGLLKVKKKGAPGDIPAQFISTKLGGDGHHRNVYPAKPNIDLNQSEIDQNKVYSFVKDRQDRSAKLYFGIIFDVPEEEEDEATSHKHYFRPNEIYYKFEFYENDKIVGATIEGKIDNKLP